MRPAPPVPAGGPIPARADLGLLAATGHPGSCREPADVISASVVYVDRPTVEVHLERPLSDQEWTATAHQFMAMAFDNHVGDAGSIRTDWIDNVLARAGVPGRGHTGQPLTGSPSSVA